MVKRLLSLAVLLATGSACAQRGPGMMEHGPGGPFRAPVTNAPYSATFTSTSTEKLQDGTVLSHSSTRTVVRDSLGRTREETTLPARGGADSTGQPRTMITIFDPVARTVTQLHTQDKTATVRTLRQPGTGDHQPPTGAHASADGTQSHGPREEKNVVKADLGAKTLGGVVANGTRVTRTIPAGAMGNAAPIVSTHEEWISPDLKVELSRTDVDPFRGTHSSVVSTLTRTEPDAALFKVPDGYTVKQATDHAFGRRGPDAHAAPPPQGI